MTAAKLAAALVAVMMIALGAEPDECKFRYAVRIVGCP